MPCGVRPSLAVATVGNWDELLQAGELTFPRGWALNCQQTSSSLRNQVESLKGGMARSCLSLPAGFSKWLQ